MGVRGEIFSTKVSLQNRTYFFNVKENRMGDLYLNIVESKNRETGGFERQSVILFADDLGEFLKGFDESLKIMEKAVKEKKKVQPRKPRAGGEEGTGRKSPAREPSVYTKKKDGPKAGKDKLPPRDKKPKPRAVRAVRRDDSKQE